MDYCSQPGLLPVDQALALMRAAITPTRFSEKISLTSALDRILSVPIYSSLNIPGHDNSAMDGYALHHLDLSTHVPLKLIGQSLAGHPYHGELRRGECVRIMTGATLPTGADTVIMQENVTAQGELIHINKPAQKGENIRYAGEDIAIDSLVFKEGKRLCPIDIGMLASLGISEVSVYKRIKVAVLSTGDELKPATQKLAKGDIYDSNRPTLVALLSRLGVEVIDMGCIADSPQGIALAFSKASAQADVVISSGGVSVGDADYTKDVMEKLGSIHFWKVAMKPGKPFAFGVLRNTEQVKETNAAEPAYFFGLPGNPVSAVVTYHQLVLPSLRYLAGEVFTAPVHLSLSTQSNLTKQPGRADYQRGKVSNLGDETQLVSTGNQSSGVLSSLSDANCYIVLEQDRGSVTAGENVKVVMFDKFIL